MPVAQRESKLTALRVDWKTLDQIKVLVGDKSAARYVRELVNDLYTKHEREVLEADIRTLAKKINTSHKFHDAVEDHLRNYTIDQLKDYRAFLQGRVDHPERGQEYYIRKQIANTASQIGATPEAVEEFYSLMGELARKQPETFQALMRQIEVTGD